MGKKFRVKPDCSQPGWSSATNICFRIVHFPKDFWSAKEFCKANRGLLLQLEYVNEVFLKRKGGEKGKLNFKCSNSGVGRFGRDYVGQRWRVPPRRLGQRDLVPQGQRGAGVIGAGLAGGEHGDTGGYAEKQTCKSKILHCRPSVKKGLFKKQAKQKKHESLLTHISMLIFLRISLLPRARSRTRL